jgi:hypothetical protein
MRGAAGRRSITEGAPLPSQIRMHVGRTFPELQTQ